MLISDLSTSSSPSSDIDEDSDINASRWTLEKKNESNISDEFSMKLRVNARKKPTNIIQKSNNTSTHGSFMSNIVLDTTDFSKFQPQSSTPYKRNKFKEVETRGCSVKLVKLTPIKWFLNEEQVMCNSKQMSLGTKEIVRADTLPTKTNSSNLMSPSMRRNISKRVKKTDSVVVSPVRRVKLKRKVAPTSLVEAKNNKKMRRPF